MASDRVRPLSRTKIETQSCTTRSLGRVALNNNGHSCIPGTNTPGKRCPKSTSSPRESIYRQLLQALELGIFLCMRNPSIINSACRLRHCLSSIHRQHPQLKPAQLLRLSCGAIWGLSLDGTSIVAPFNLMQRYLPSLGQGKIPISCQMNLWGFNQELPQSRFSHRRNNVSLQKFFQSSICIPKLSSMIKLCPSPKLATYTFTPSPIPSNSSLLPQFWALISSPLETTPYSLASVYCEFCLDTSMFKNLTLFMKLIYLSTSVIYSLVHGCL